MSRYSDITVRRLIDRKTNLEKRISEELKRPMPDTLKLQGLKRARLALKDRVSRLMKSHPYDVMPAVVRVN